MPKYFTRDFIKPATAFLRMGCSMVPLQYQDKFSFLDKRKYQIALQPKSLLKRSAVISGTWHDQ